MFGGKAQDSTWPRHTHSTWADLGGFLEDGVHPVYLCPSSPHILLSYLLHGLQDSQMWSINGLDAVYSQGSAEQTAKQQALPVHGRG